MVLKTVFELGYSPVIRLLTPTHQSRILWANIYLGRGIG
nr:MAG TPA_asm: hypothetical protein [Caudoviricetes sp.]